MEITICTDPWELIDVDAFLCPTNQEGRMSHYPASKVAALAGRPGAGAVGRAPALLGPRPELDLLFP